MRQTYIEILVGRLEMQAAGLQISAAEQSLKESTDGVFTGNLLDVAVLRQKTTLLQNKYQLSKLENQISDLTGDLNELIGFPIDTGWSFSPFRWMPRHSCSRWPSIAIWGLSITPKSRRQRQLPTKRGRCPNREGELYSRSRGFRTVHVSERCPVPASQQWLDRPADESGMYSTGENGPPRLVKRKPDKRKPKRISSA